MSITSSNSVGQAGDAISAPAGGDITISGAHTVLGTGDRGYHYQGVGVTGGVSPQRTASHASGGTGGNINIGDMTAIGNVTAAAPKIGDDDGTDSSISTQAVVRS